MRTRRQHAAMKPPLPLTSGGITSRMTRSASKEKALLPGAKPDAQTEHKGVFLMRITCNIHNSLREMYLYTLFLFLFSMFCSNCSTISFSSFLILLLLQYYFLSYTVPAKRKSPLFVSIQNIKDNALCELFLPAYVYTCSSSILPYSITGHDVFSIKSFSPITSSDKN